MTDKKDSIPSVAYKDRIFEAADSLNIPGVKVFAIFIFLKNGRFTWPYFPNGQIFLL